MPDAPLRIAVVWPKPRAARWRLGRTHPAEYPDLSDGLLYLEAEGFEVDIEESLGFPWNPLIDMHEFYSGLDPFRAARVASRARRYDAVVCVGDVTAYVLLKLRQLLGLSLPILLVDPALSEDYPRRRRLQDVILPHVDHVVVFGQKQLEVLSRRYQGAVRASFLPHRIDSDFYTPAPPRQVSGVPMVFSIGNDGSRDFDTLAKAIPIVQKQVGRPVRVLVQSTRPVPAVDGLEVNREHVSHLELRALYRAASVVAIPLKDTIHPGGINSLLEAMATGCAVVSSRSAGVADYLVDGRTASLVDPCDPVALAGAIAALLDSEARCRQLGGEARTFAAATCDNRVYARSLAPLIASLVHKRTGRASGERHEVRG